MHKRGEQTVKELMALLDDIQACMFRKYAVGICK